MSPVLLGALALVGVLAGLVGVFVPVVPGLVLVWAATTGSLLLTTRSPLVWAVVLVLTLLAVAGTVASTALPARRTRGDGVPAASLGWTVVGAIVGFVVIPVVGVVVGAGAGLLLAEQRRLGEWEPAWRSTRRMAAAYGIGVLLELVAGMVMGVVWLTTFVLVA